MRKYLLVSLLFFISFALTGQDFVTEWKQVTSEVSFYAETSGTVNYTWSAYPSGESGSGSFAPVAVDQLITLTGLTAMPGDTVVLSLAPQNIDHFYCSTGYQYNPSAENLIAVKNWGAVAWTSMEEMFRGCYGLKEIPASPPNLSGVTNMSHMFDTVFELDQDIGNWDVSTITNMSYALAGSGFTHDLSSWDVSNVTDMSGLFSFTGFDQDISGWDVSNVTNMRELFAASSFNQDISGWDVSNVTDMSSMFRNNSSFDQDISGWDVSNVQNMSEMFSNSSYNRDISSWNVAAVTNMEQMFSGSDFNQDISSWNVSMVDTMSGMFQANTVFNRDISSWDVANVVDMSRMFSNSPFNQDISSWDVSSVQDMSNLFSRSDFNQDISSWDFSSVTDMSDMFEGNDVFNHDVSSWNVANVQDMSGMFKGAAFNQDLSSWDVSNVTDMSNMFQSNTVFNQDLSSWDVSNVTNMFAMFNGASAFDQSLGSWTFNPTVDLSFFFSSATMSCGSYSASLIGWASNPNTPDNLTMSAIGQQYGTNALAARDMLVNTKNWILSGDSPSGTVCALSLPVTYAQKLAASLTDKEVHLSFSTAQEVNTSHFDIQHSTDGDHFSTIGTLEAQGNSNTEVKYYYTHGQPDYGINYYRIKQVDLDGQQQFSEVARVMYQEDASDITLYPNPASDVVYLNHLPASANIVVLNTLGEVMIRNKARNQVDVSRLPAGLYTFQITENDKLIWSDRLIKQ